VVGESESGDTNQVIGTLLELKMVRPTGFEPVTFGVGELDDTQPTNL